MSGTPFPGSLELCLSGAWVSGTLTDRRDQAEAAAMARRRRRARRRAKPRNTAEAVDRSPRCRLECVRPKKEEPAPRAPGAWGDSPSRTSVCAAIHHPFERELIALYSFPAPRRLTSSSPGSPKENRTPVSFCGGKNCVLPVPT